MRKINKIIVHCTATPEGRDVSVDDIRIWHAQRGFTDIGYHYVILLDGTIADGRPIELSGAHTVGHNHDSIGVAYVGGMSKDMKRAKDTRNESQKNSLATLLKSLVIQFPNVQIFGHRDFAHKDCPSFDAKTEYKII